VFRDIDVDEVKWSTDLGQDLDPMPQAAIVYFVKSIMQQTQLVGSHEILYEKLKFYILNYLFNKPVALDDLNVIRNLSDDRVRVLLLELFIKTINRLEHRLVG